MDIEEFFVTFGVQYTTDPERGKVHRLGMHKDGYAVIEAPDYDMARRIAAAIFGVEWAFIYDKEDFIDSGMRAKWYSPTGGELLRIKWIQP